MKKYQNGSTTLWAIIAVITVIIVVIAFSVWRSGIFLPWNGQIQNETESEALKYDDISICNRLPTTMWGDDVTHPRQGCIDKVVSSDNKKKITNMSQCSTIGNQYGMFGMLDNQYTILACERYVAAKTGDWKYCETVTDNNASTARELRLACFAEVGLAGDIQGIVINNKDNQSVCQPFNGLKKDICFFNMAEYSKVGKTYCDYIQTSQVLKNDCVNF